MKHFKTEVNEIRKGEECGVIFFNFNDIQPGDVIEAFEVTDYEPEFFWGIWKKIKKIIISIYSVCMSIM